MLHDWPLNMPSVWQLISVPQVSVLTKLNIKYVSGFNNTNAEAVLVAM